MEKAQPLEQFEKFKSALATQGSKAGLERFNVFSLKDAGGQIVNCQPYNRKGFYKISLLNGLTRLFYADKTIEFDKNGLLFSSPHIPYAWEHIGDDQSGYFCVFEESFFDHYAHLKEYPIFKPGNSPLFELTDDQASAVTAIFQKMQAEISSDFVYKYDVLRNQVLELIYLGLKLQPNADQVIHESNGSVRIAALFTELLERQFPIASVNQQMKFRSPVEFAGQLAIHVNHLNRALKEVTGKTTSQLIAERILLEARGLLKHTDWNISEIAWCLGFEELPHFINFFKKSAETTPKAFRQLQNI
jgi:AraC family transcriptional activator of pobA